MSPVITTYEQPLNECVRLCLRLEFLFQKAKHYIDDDSGWGTRTTLETILEILNVADRPDLKTKLSKALGMYVVSLSGFIGKKLPSNIDEKKLIHLHDQINQMLEKLNNSGRAGQNLKENEFIITILQRMSTSGGTCAFSVPSYHLWLQQSVQIRRKQLDEWLSSFLELKAIISLLLRLIRESVILDSAVAKHGFYQMDFDTRLAYQMVRVALPTADLVYPEISVGRHRLSIHFYELNTFGRPVQMNKDIKFDLACCKI
ncbi:MAG: hypothetical protein A2X78_04590 [Gammaproteobacteria bacterium GWE2_37_16]|nr:MAG: hypothetical protein A2X78_04590 [Gammaproteobacteria bacterium GWE2_37_16]